MNSTLEPEGSNIQKLDVVYSGGVEVREPIKEKLQVFDNQKGDREPVKETYIRKVEAWRQPNPEGSRQMAPLCIIGGLLVIWFLIGLVVFLKTGNFELLASASGTLVVFLMRMINHYLPSS